MNGRWNRAQETSSPSGQLPHNGAANANLNWERGEVGVVGTPATNEATEADEAARLDALHSVDAYDDITEKETLTRDGAIARARAIINHG